MTLEEVIGLYAADGTIRLRQKDVAFLHTYYADLQRLGVENNDPKDLVLFDVDIHRKGFLGPDEFLEYFGHLPVAEVIYRGKLTEEFYHDVRNGKYDLNEGVMCKGGERHNFWMCKIKTLDYLKRLKEKYVERWHEFWE